MLEPVIIAICAVIAVTSIIYAVIRSRSRAQAQTERAQLAEQLDKQNKALKAEERELQIQAKETKLKLREQFEKEQKQARAEIARMQDRIDKRQADLDKRHAQLEKDRRNIEKQHEQVKAEKNRAQKLLDERTQELQRIAAMSIEEARQLLLAEVKQHTRQDAAELIHAIEQEAKETATHKAAQIVTDAVQRCAVDQTTETTVSVVPLPNDDMKGRIIGRQGRNIRTFEKLTGIDLIVDDTPEAVVVSGFDPVRREIARVALESLLADGRIHPGRIEDTVNRARSEIKERMRQAAQNATMDTGVSGLNTDLLQMLGKLKFRTSFGQNVLQHSIEVSHLAGMMASEIGARVHIARRGGLLHDIGKAVDHEREGTHTQIGAEIARTRGESDSIIHCIEAHHGDVEIKTIEAALVQASDAISAARPGARRETLETYIKRLESLENLAEAYNGVHEAYAIQAGREVRVIVEPNDIDDLQAHNIAKKIASKIETELDYPGQIRVTVIRETRSVEYAK